MTTMLHILQCVACTWALLGTALCWWASYRAVRGRMGDPGDLKHAEQLFDRGLLFLILAAVILR